ncbi:MAG: DNA double-strand break repair Rad50 ATPase [Rhodospirillaceae bacterium]|nr:DNA double-strand break repair Rad50 ATPase [Rhodospirillaceae bacterium]
MRIRRLDLLRYGHFTDMSLKLPVGKSDFHIVFGPNEAGKSTALSAVEDLLFGIPIHSSYGFLHDYSNMRVGAVLENGADALEVVRRKGSKDTLLGHDGSPVPGGDSVLRPYLAGSDRTFYERMFSLDHTRLEAGGREILEAKDDVGQMLFSAGAGIGGLRERLNELAAEADGLWSPGRRAKHRKFSIAEDKLGSASKELREHTLSATKWRELKKTYEEAEETYDTIDKAITEATTTRTRLSRIRRVFRDVRRKQELDGLLNAIGGVIELPEDAAVLVAEAERNEAQIGTSIDTLREQLQRAEEELEKLTYDETILQRAVDIRQVCERRIEIRGEKADLPKREAELHAAENQLKGDAAELGWRDGDSGALIDRIPPRPKISVMRALLNQKGELESDVAGSTLLLDESRDQYAELKEKLAEAGEPVDVARLAIALKVNREQGDIVGRVRVAEQGLEISRKRVTRRLSALDPAVGDEAALTSISVPTRAKIQSQRDAQDAWQQQLKETQQQAISVRDELDGAIASLERVVRDEQVVSAEELRNARSHRDAVWQLVKREHIEGQPIPADLATQHKDEIENLTTAYESAVIRTDELTDRRFDHAEAVGRITEIKRKIGEQKTLLEQVNGRERTLVEEGQKLEADWVKLWAGAPFEPKEADTMLKWLDDRDEVVEAIEAREEAEGSLKSALGEDQAARQNLLAELAAIRVDAGSLEKDSLMTIVERAEKELRVHEAEADRKCQLEKGLDEANKLVTRRQRGLETAKRALGEWQEKWVAALEGLGLAASTAAEAVDAQIIIIDQMRETAGRINSLQHDRIEKIHRDVADFEKVVDGLVDIVAPDLTDAAADDAMATLETRLKEAERVQGLREKQHENIEVLKEQIETLRGQQRELASSISHLKQTADVDDNDKLKAAIELSDNQRALQTERQEIIDKLQQDGDGNSVEELEGECEGLVIDEVTAQEESLQAELDDLRGQQVEAADVRSQARQAFQAIGGGAAAAQAAAIKEEALTEMGEVAERYVRVKTSSILLQWAIDRYRREKQGPLLKRAGQLFQILTSGSFSSLRVDFDDQDKAHLTGVRPGEAVVPVSGMSTGTADQLYLSLRVASIEDYLGRADALPFVADDLFVNFDNDRAMAGFRLLGQLAESTQVLFFTHHQHLVDIAQEALGTSVHVVHLTETKPMMAS